MNNGDVSTETLLILAAIFIANAVAAKQFVLLGFGLVFLLWAAGRTF